MEYYSGRALYHMYYKGTIPIHYKKGWNSAIWEYYAKWNKSVRKSQEPYDLTNMWDIKLKLIDTDNSVAVARGKEWGDSGG